MTEPADPRGVLEQLAEVGEAGREVAGRERVLVDLGSRLGLSWRAMARALGVHHRTLHNRHAGAGAAARRRTPAEVAA